MALRSNLSKFIQVTGIVILIMGLHACGPDPKRVEDAEISFKVAKQFYAKSDIPQALSNALKARKQDPSNPEIHNFLGLMYFQRANLMESEKSFEKATKLDPKYSEAFNHLCMVQTENKKYDRALLSCQRAVENILYATPERAYHNMAILYEKKGESDKAIEAYKKAIDINKRFVMSLKGLALIYLSQRKHFDALGYLEQAAKVCRESPKGIWQNECPEAHYHLALVYIQLQKRDKALTSLEDCLKSSDTNSEIINKCRVSLRAYK